MLRSLVGSEMCIRDSIRTVNPGCYKRRSFVRSIDRAQITDAPPTTRRRGQVSEDGACRVLLRGLARGADSGQKQDGRVVRVCVRKSATIEIRSRSQSNDAPRETSTRARFRGRGVSRSVRGLGRGADPGQKQYGRVVARTFVSLRHGVLRRNTIA